MPHGAMVATTNFEQSVPKEDMLYLDKAWSSLQALSAPADVVEITDDVTELHRTFKRREPRDEEDRYVLDHLGKAVEFVACVATSNRGFAYMIGESKFSVARVYRLPATRAFLHGAGT